MIAHAALREQDERLLWRFLSFTRATGLALCADVYTHMAPAGAPRERQHWVRSWQPLTEGDDGEHALLTDFAAWLQAHDQDQDQGHDHDHDQDHGEEGRR